jgi:glycosyltransferase involved in cell wall biosynthesis
MRVLVLLPCQPFPAYNGQTHRLAHLARSLARRHQVWLGALVEPHQTAPFPADLRPLFAEVCLAPMAAPDAGGLARWRRRLWGVPHDVARFAVPALADFVARVVAEHDPDVIVTGDPALDQHLPQGGRARVIAMDYVCETVLQIERMAELAPPPGRWLWQGRRRKQVRFLQGISGHYDLVFLNSAEDRDSLARFWPAGALHHVPNGLELDQYPSGLAAPVPDRLIYPGSVLYPPNRDAVAWFATRILPRLRAARPGVELRVTGAAGPDAPQAEGLVYTGRVPDVRAEIAAAWACVVPLRLGAGGARFKVIESLALGTPVIGTAIGVEGLELAHGTDYLAAEGEEAIAAACLQVLADPGLRARLSAGGRRRMEAAYSWATHFARIEALIAARLPAARAA